MSGNCESCGEYSDQLLEVDLSDRSVGYIEFVDWCPACRHGEVIAAPVAAGDPWPEAEAMILEDARRGA